ncbi:MAG: UDP-N-acetylmuramoyl-tripeptide--D-alanyl-D-alanine ligase [Clostridia bacterium]|nr:UDP-N-acetylmuramoyl-tripeptide--D-alanyl-D-alanine ligase [Clostridia bacterium]
MRTTDAAALAEACAGRVIGFGTASCSRVETDSRKVSPGALFIALKGERADGHDYIGKAFEAGAYIVLSERETEVPEGRALILVNNTRLALGDIARWYRTTLDMKVVGITGSVGKTSTKEFVYAVLSEKYKCYKTKLNFNNDLGLPLTVLSIEPDCECAVLEMGMNHFGEIDYLTKIARPDIAVITNIGVAHIEHLGSRENILKAKLEILSGLAEGGTVVINGDEPLLWNARGGALSGYKTYTYGVKNKDVDLFADGVRRLEDGMAFSTDGLLKTDVKILAPGAHNVQNALCAMCVGHALGLSADEIKRGLLRYEQIEKRLNFIKSGGVVLIDDTYNANPDSMRAAIKVLESSEGGRKIAVLGDMLELGSYSKEAHEILGADLCEAGVDAVFLKGENTKYTLSRVSGKIKDAFFFESDEALTESLKKYAKPDDVILIKGSHGMKMENILRLWKAGERDC